MRLWIVNYNYILPLKPKLFLLSAVLNHRSMGLIMRTRTKASIITKQ